MLDMENRSRTTAGMVKTSLVLTQEEMACIEQVAEDGEMTKSSAIRMLLCHALDLEYVERHRGRPKK